MRHYNRHQENLETIRTFFLKKLYPIKFESLREMKEF